MLLSVFLMERSVTLPDIISNNGHFPGVVFLQGPASFGLIMDNVVEEISLEYGVICFKTFFLGWVLHISKVRIKLKFETFMIWQTNEGFILVNLMLKCQLHGPLGDNMA